MAKQTTANLPAIRAEIETHRDQFGVTLAGDVPTDKFMRSVFIQFEKNPDLYQCDPVSIIDACNRAAIDGLLLDGREAALVIYNMRDGDGWKKVAQYIPMYMGLLKRVYKSGFVSTVSVHVVYENELLVDETLGRPRFVYTAGDREEIIHDPIVMGAPGKPAIVYSIVRMKDGSISRDVMSITRVLAIAKKQAKNWDERESKLKGIWSSEFIEMAKKTVLRHHTKTLPKDARVEQAIQHLDEAEPFTDPIEETAAPAPSTRKRARAAAEKLAPKPEAEDIDQTMGEVVSDEPEYAETV